MVEGYMDVLALASAGYQGSVVAVLSAHISIEQLDLAWRFSKTPIIALDNDLAGFSGMVKIATEALPEINADKSLKFLNIKNSKDPDEFIRKYGINQWYQVIQDHSITLADFILMINTPSDHSPHQQLQYKNNINNLLKTIKDKDTKNEYYTYFNVLNNKNQYTLELIKNKFYINNQNAVVNRSLQALQIIYNHLEDLDDETIEILSQIKLINEDIDILRNSIVMHYSFRDNINQSNKSKIKRCLNICLLDIIQYEIQLLSNQLVLNENSTLEKQLFVLKNHELNLIQEIKDNIK
jgi:DNA primase